MYTTDLMHHLLAWTWGQCILWNQQVNQFADVNHQEFQSFVHRTRRGGLLGSKVRWCWDWHGRLTFGYKFQ